jgi:hypothetical protein
VVTVVTANGLVPVIGAAINWAGPTVTVAVTASQKIVVTAESAIGTGALAGVNLRILICYSASGSLAHDNNGLNGLTAPASTRQVYSLSTMLTGLTGTYQVGLCATGANFTSTDRGYVTAIVMN